MLGFILFNPTLAQATLALSIESENHLADLPPPKAVGGRLMSDPIEIFWL
jgi:hypothetical protein